jgi:hypothetical protein
VDGDPEDDAMKLLTIGLALAVLAPPAGAHTPPTVTKTPPLQAEVAPTPELTPLPDHKTDARDDWRLGRSVAAGALGSKAAALDAQSAQIDAMADAAAAKADQQMDAATAALAIGTAGAAVQIVGAGSAPAAQPAGSPKGSGAQKPRD